MAEEKINQKKTIKTFRDLIVWQKSIQFVSDIYFITKSFPREELFSLINQIRRSAVSIPSNIAEGFGRHSRKDYLRFLKIAIASTFEIQTQIEISKNLRFISEDVYNKIFESSREIERMLSSLILKLRA